jgi:hypothetical protein
MGLGYLVIFKEVISSGYFECASIMLISYMIRQTQPQQFRHQLYHTHHYLNLHCSLLAFTIAVKYYQRVK